MSKRTYIIDSYDPTTRKVEHVTVTREVFNACRRTNWNMIDKKKSFFKHEIQMCSLIGGENGSYEYFREFVVASDELERVVAKRMLQDALYQALSELKESDYDLINATYFEGKTLAEYAAENQVSVSALCERRKRILRDLKKLLKKFDE